MPKFREMKKQPDKLMQEKPHQGLQVQIVQGAVEALHSQTCRN